MKQSQDRISAAEAPSFSRPRLAYDEPTECRDSEPIGEFACGTGAYGGPRASTILFDFDGVLLDSSLSVQRLWHRWSTPRGLDAASVEADAHGRRGRDVIRQYAPELDPVAEEERLTRWQLEEDTDRLFDGASQLLAQLAAPSWAIVTSGSRELTLARLRRAGLDLPAVLITADDVEHGKPSPEGYLHAAQKLGAAPTGCIVVEDAPAGIEAGLAAGMFVVGVATTFAADALSRAHQTVSTLIEFARHLSVTADGVPSWNEIPGRRRGVDHR